MKNFLLIITMIIISAGFLTYNTVNKKRMDVSNQQYINKNY